MYRDFLSRLYPRMRAFDSISFCRHAMDSTYVYLRTFFLLYVMLPCCRDINIVYGSVCGALLCPCYACLTIDPHSHIFLRVRFEQTLPATPTSVRPMGGC